jgi:hypothetical protein
MIASTTVPAPSLEVSLARGYGIGAATEENLIGGGLVVEPDR